MLGWWRWEKETVIELDVVILALSVQRLICKKESYVDEYQQDD